MTEVIIVIYTYEAATDFANKLDYAGKFIFVKDDAYANIEKHDNWQITYYVVCYGDKLRRCGKKFADDMITADKVIIDGTRQDFKARRGR